MNFEEIQAKARYDERMKIRKRIQERGTPMYDLFEPPLKYLIGEIMALNEEWCLNHPDTYGYDTILDHGFNANQLKYIEALKP